METLISNTYSVPYTHDNTKSYTAMPSILSNHIKYSIVPVYSDRDVMTHNVLPYLTNEKIYPYNQCVIDYSNSDSDLTTYIGHVLLGKEVYAIQQSDDPDILSDIINASFYILSRDPQMSVALIQSFLMLQKVMITDTNPVVNQNQTTGVLPYEL